MPVPEADDELRITLLGTITGLLDGRIRKVELLGCKDGIKWKQEDQALVIQCPSKMNFSTAVGFSIVAK